VKDAAIKHKPGDVQTHSEVKSIATYVNGLAVRSLSVPNMPATISGCDSKKAATGHCRKSDASFQMSTSGVRLLSSNSSDNTANGHPVVRLSPSSSVSKLTFPNSCRMTSSPATRDTSDTIKTSMPECPIKQSKPSACESSCSKIVFNGCANRTPAGQKTHVQAGSGYVVAATKHVKDSSSKFGCCLNLHKNDRVRDSGSSIEIRDGASCVGVFSHGKSVDSTERTRKHAKKLSDATKVSFLSTTKWCITRRSDDDVLRSSHDTVRATTAWCVTDIAVSQSVAVSSGNGDSISATVKQSDTSWTEAVCGGQQRMQNVVSTSRSETGDAHHASDRPTVNCTYMTCSI